ncbi:MAG: 16S rRNA (cytosine(1402)-N(4))-methyltransferase RsmH [Clostridia bacterium]|nr:16S rRNA (cytosine(1402)-N(4))-methyltransferase RsmH [Clostridia bacterium]
MSAQFEHLSVMLDEAVDALNVRPGLTYLDGTAGGGGHSSAIAERLAGSGRLIAVDQDPAAIEAAGRRLAQYGAVCEICRSNFSEIKNILGDRRVDGVLLDLGVSSHQLDSADRGFSYMKDAALDMRMDTDALLDAGKVVNTYSREELTRILRDWGEERFAGRIASFIVNERENAPIETTGQLAELVKRAIPNWGGETHPEKRTFQAIRIEVNRELDVIEPALEGALDCMNPGGRIAVITFHSLEDRIVKQFFAKAAKGCTCPPEIPVCVCGKKPRGRVITRKPILPTKEECERNPRSKSAKLRVFEAY